MRKTRIKRGGSLLLAAVMLISALGLPAYATISEEKQNLSDLKDQKNDVQALINGLQADKAAIEQNIEVLDAELSSISEDLYETENELKSVEKKINKNEKKLKKAEEDIAQQYAAMKLRIQFMYENGNQEMLSLILSSENIADFLNKADYISELSTYDRRMLTKMQETKATIEATKATLEEQRTTLTALKKEQEQHKADIETLVAAKIQEMAAYDSQIAANEAALDELDTAIGNQEEVIAEMESIEAERAAAAAAAKKNTVTEGNEDSGGSPAGSTNVVVPSGGYTWPLPGHTAVSSGFGFRSDPFSGKQTYHSGIDLPAPSGTTIVAAKAGQVAWSNYSTTAGNWIGIDHGNGLYTVYMHMSARLASEGENVSAGETIGLVGTTGSSTGNHLHFSVRVNGVYTNPMSYVRP